MKIDILLIHYTTRKLVFGNLFSTENYNNIAYDDISALSKGNSKSTSACVGNKLQLLTEAPLAGGIDFAK